MGDWLMTISVSPSVVCSTDSVVCSVTVSGALVLSGSVALGCSLLSHAPRSMDVANKIGIMPKINLRTGKSSLQLSAVIVPYFD
jgi:hypothetical protein